MKLIVGLGNPGRKHASNRHNIGMMAIDHIADHAGVASWRQRFSGSFAEARIQGERLQLLRPETYMNNSGMSVAAARDYYKTDMSDILILHDEIDLAPGKVRIKQGGGHAGHNGLRSIIAHVGPEFVRIRLGIGHPGHKDLVHGHVLGDFSRLERDEWLDALLRATGSNCQLLVKTDYARFVNEVTLAIRTRKTPATPRTKPIGTRQAAQERAGKPASTWQEKLRDMFGIGNG